MRFSGAGAGGIGPSLGEAVLTHEGRGVIVSVDEGGFVVKMRDGTGDLDSARLFPLSEYEAEKDGRFVRCVWDCGYGNLEIRCFLEKGHAGPHLFKLR